MPEYSFVKRVSFTYLKNNLCWDIADFSLDVGYPMATVKFSPSGSRRLDTA